jgi:hypothetical protein
MPISEKRKTYNREYAERTHRVAVTLTPEEYRRLEKRAEALGIRPTTLAKELILSKSGKPETHPEIIRDELQQIKFLLRNVANNINQIAHYSNRIKHMVNENDLLLELQKMEKAVYKWINAQ